MAAGTSGHAGDSDIESVLDQAIAGEHRSEKNKARDQYRHPKEPLRFFGLHPDMTAVEIWPGGGWYTEILAPALRERGRFYAARFSLKNAPDFRKEIDAGYGALLAANPDVYGKVVSTEFEAPEFSNIAPRDRPTWCCRFAMCTTGRKPGTISRRSKAFHAALKPGGVLGVVEHRAKPATPLPDMIRTGYMTEDYVIELAEKAGFKLAAKSEINANPKDTKDYPKGVWTLPPSLRLGDTERERYLAIGESDRMTLKFVKPK